MTQKIFKRTRFGQQVILLILKMLFPLRQQVDTPKALSGKVRSGRLNAARALAVVQDSLIQKECNFDQSKKILIQNDSGYTAEWLIDDTPGGITVPSTVDISTYLKTSPQKALITNGIETIGLDQKDFVKLKNLTSDQKP